MKLSGVLAVILSASIPTSAFAQTFSASQAGAAAQASVSGAAGTVQIVPSGLGGTASLSVLSIAPGPTLAPGITPTALTLSAVLAAAKPEAVRTTPTAAPAPSVLPAPAAEQNHTPGEIAALRAAWQTADEHAETASGLEEYHPGMRLFDGAAENPSKVSAPQTGMWGRIRNVLRQSPTVPAQQQDAWSELKLSKQVLGDGTASPDGSHMRAFAFQTPSGEMKARSAGLEGFLYSRRELARAGVSTIGQLDDQFKYLDALLAPAPRARYLREELARLSAERLSSAVKDGRLDILLAAAVKELRTHVLAADPAAEAARQNATYMIFTRAYNRLKPGMNFLDSLDAAEILRLKNEPTIRANEIWLMDIFEIGEINRWGTGGGSSYSIKGYRVKPELGGDAGLKAFVARAHAAGVRVKVDFIPNHTSLDSDMVKAVPEGFLHVLPPQNLSDDQIMAAVPREKNGNHTSIYKLVDVDSYPMPDGTRRPARVLIHHPRTDYGDVMWVDLAQIDYSRPEARAWQTRELTRLFTDLGVDSVRRDMAYEILNSRYYNRWQNILASELKAIPPGWMRDAHQGVIDGLKTRWAALQGAEFLEEATDAVKGAKPQAVMIDEAYAHADGLSRAGSDGIYNKNDHDSAEGQIGLYDAMQSGDADRIRQALKHAAFRRWQRGGAPMVNFMGTHDGGEGNPVDKFGRLFQAAALTALMLRPILLYNGFEQAVGQRDNVIGDLSQSVDLEKAIPYDIPVKIDWSKADPKKQSFLRLVLGVGAENQKLFDQGAMEVLETTAGTPLAAWTVSHEGKTFLMAANWAANAADGAFRFAAPILSDFGAFSPRENRRYLLRDLADVVDGKPREYVRDGKDLIENGLYIKLEGGGTHLFEVIDLSAGVVALAAPRSVAPAPTHSFAERWDRWTQHLTDSAAVAFLALQIPQIISNISNLINAHPEQLANLPWMGYSTGILGNMLLLSWFASQKEKSAARVQAIGVVTSLMVVVQIALAGFMPAAAFWTVVPLIAAGLALNWLKFKDKIPAGLWSLWSRASSLLGLVVLPQVLWTTFATAAMFSYLPGLIAGGLGLAMIAFERAGRLPAPLQNVWSSLSAWTATLLFMYGPVAQLMANAHNPAGMAGISILTLLLASSGNLLMLPRAMLTKNAIWFTGSAWAVFAGGWAVMLTMYLAGFVAAPLFWAFTAFLPLYLGAAHLLNRRARRTPPR